MVPFFFFGLPFAFCLRVSLGVHLMYPQLNAVMYWTFFLIFVAKMCLTFLYFDFCAGHKVSAQIALLSRSPWLVLLDRKIATFLLHNSLSWISRLLLTFYLEENFVNKRNMERLSDPGPSVVLFLLEIGFEWNLLCKYFICLWTLWQFDSE